MWASALEFAARLIGGALVAWTERRAAVREMKKQQGLLANVPVDKTEQEQYYKDRG